MLRNRNQKKPRNIKTPPPPPDIVTVKGTQYIATN